MTRVTLTTRLSLGLGFLTLSVLLAAQALRLVPDAVNAAMKGRAELCESIAIYNSLLVQKDDIPAMLAGTRSIVIRHPEVLSAAVRRSDGKLLFQIGDHEYNWAETPSGESTPTHVRVPIIQGGKQWGAVEMFFTPLSENGFWSFLTRPTVRLISFVGLASILLYCIFLRKSLAYLDPSSVISDRVKVMLDTLAEGVLVLDHNQRIVLANQAFGQMTGESAPELQGRMANKFPWTGPNSSKPSGEYPWTSTIRAGTTVTGIPLGLSLNSKFTRAIMVNCVAIRSGSSIRGALVTFDDVTEVEQKNARLRDMLEMLEQSQAEINRQNKELQALATTDPMTGCLNRRAFFEAFQTHWSNAKRYGHTLGCIMVDVDHFKKINDTHGHSTGDKVLQHVAEVLKTAARDTDVVCRYGGEEFCILLPQAGIEETAKASRAPAAADRGRAIVRVYSFPQVLAFLQPIWTPRTRKIC